MFRYPIAWAIKSPKVIVPFAAWTRAASSASRSSPPSLDAKPGDVTPGGAVGERGFLALDVAEVVFISRLFLKALLETRNDVLSRSIEGRVRGDARSSDGGGVVQCSGFAHLRAGVQLRLMGDGDDEWWVGAGRRGSGEGAGEDVAAEYDVLLPG